MSYGPGPDHQATAPTTRRDVQWVGFVASSTSFVVWGLRRAVFHEDMPVEVVGLVQYGVPLALGWLAGEVRWRTARRRGDPTPPQDS